MSATLMLALLIAPCMQESDQPDIEPDWVTLTIKAPGQRETVLKYLFANLDQDLGLSTATREKLTEAGKEMQDFLVEFCDKHAMDLKEGDPRLRSYFLEKFFRSLDEEESSEMQKGISPLREKARDTLGDEKLDILINAAIDREGVTALRYEEIYGKFNFSEEQETSIHEALLDARRTIQFRIGVPSSYDRELRLLMEEMGLGYTRSPPPGQTGELVVRASLQFQVDVFEILTEEQLDLLRELFVDNKENDQ